MAKAKENEYTALISLKFPLCVLMSFSTSLRPSSRISIPFCFSRVDVAHSKRGAAIILNYTSESISDYFDRYARIFFIDFILSSNESFFDGINSFESETSDFEICSDLDFIW